MDWHRVAFHLGGRTVEEWQAAMTSAEFCRWRAFFRLEPAGFQMDNWRAGMIAATFANVTLQTRGRKRFAPDDFYPQIRSRR
jgi:hypothetical protein